jgi:ABC-type multidrug transport system fused ATPase/permease subunit
VEQFISIVIFSLPGLLTYFWLQLFGVNPTVKHSSTEMIGIAALLWMPTTLLSALSYNFLYFVTDKTLLMIGVDLSQLQLTYVTGVLDIVALSSNTLFIIYLIFLSFSSSFIVAFLWASYVYKIVMYLINKVRIYRKVSKLSQETSVWDTFFIKLEKQEESPLVVEMYKIDQPNNKVVGSVIRSSRPYEPERAIILDNPDDWKESHEYYKFPVKKAYIDTKNGLVVNELDHEIKQAKK